MITHYGRFLVTLQLCCMFLLDAWGKTFHTSRNISKHQVNTLTRTNLSNPNGQPIHLENFTVFSRWDRSTIIVLDNERTTTYNLIQSTDNNKTEQHLAICIDIFFMKANQNAVKFVTYDLLKFQLRIPFQLAPSCYLRFSNNHLPGWIRNVRQNIRGKWSQRNHGWEANRTRHRPSILFTLLCWACLF